MTTEQKAKAYDMALSTAKMWRRNTAMPDNVKEILSKIFPELQESEDERIREELIFYFGNMPEDTELRNGVTNRDALVWLEKQSKSVPKTPQDEKCWIDAYCIKPIDGVIPFNIGDWVVRKDGENFSNGSKKVQIVAIDKDQYWFSCGTWLYAKDIRHWTIADKERTDLGGELYE